MARWLELVATRSCSTEFSELSPNMSARPQAAAKLLNERACFIWQGLVTLLHWLGYRQLECAGSRVKFDNGAPLR